MYGYMSTQRCLGASGSKTTIIRSDEASSNSDYGKPGMFGADLNASYYTIEQPYTLMYTTASQASYIIETAPSVDFSGNEELRNAYMGEAYFWRAFAHYYLLINFRNISPIRQMPRNGDDYVRPLEKPAAVWDFIQEDLTHAKELLPVKGYWDNKNAGRVTKASAAALLGKAYLYRSGIEQYYGEDKTTFYSEAAKEFGDVIDGKYGTYDLTKNYADQSLSIIQSGFLLVTSISSLLLMNWMLTLLAIILSVITLYIPRFTRQKASNATQKVVSRNSKYLLAIEEWFNGLEEFKKIYCF